MRMVNSEAASFFISFRNPWVKGTGFGIIYQSIKMNHLILIKKSSSVVIKKG